MAANSTIEASGGQLPVSGKRAAKNALSHTLLAYVLVFTAVLLVFALIVAAIRQTPNTSFASSAVALGVIAGIAVGIERALEVFWTVVGQIKGPCWPLDMVGQFNTLVASLDEQLAPFSQRAQEAITAAAKAGGWTQQQLDAAGQALDEVKNGVGTLKSMAPSNRRVTRLSDASFQHVSALVSILPALQNDAKAVNAAIADVSDFANTFQENPGRKLISVYLGALLGLMIAGVLGLDLFSAAGGQGIAWLAPVFPSAGIAITGVVIGLGSNPTHEIIQAVQEYKNSNSKDK
jgi:hypothetical protein